MAWGRPEPRLAPTGEAGEATLPSSLGESPNRTGTGTSREAGRDGGRLGSRVGGDRDLGEEYLHKCENKNIQKQ